MILKIIKKTQSFFRTEHYKESTPDEYKKLYMFCEKSKIQKTFIKLMYPFGILNQIIIWLLFGYVYELNGLGLRHKSLENVYYVAPIYKSSLYQRILAIYTLIAMIILSIGNGIFTQTKSMDFCLDVFQFCIYDKPLSLKNRMIILVYVGIFMNIVFASLLIVFNINIFVYVLWWSFLYIFYKLCEIPYDK